MPRIDYFEASVPTAPADVRAGDQVAVSWFESHTVLDTQPTPSGAYIRLRGPSGPYTVHRRSALPIVKP